jgi:hypothetical protein
VQFFLLQINQGGDIPEKYYMTNLTSTDRESMERVVIGRRSTHKVTLEVDKCGSVIQWEFVSSQHDIAFGIYQQAEKQNGKKNKSELVRYQHYHKHYSFYYNSLSSQTGQPSLSAFQHIFSHINIVENLSLHVAESSNKFTKY